MFSKELSFKEADALTVQLWLEHPNDFDAIMQAHLKWNDEKFNWGREHNVVCAD